METKKRLYSKIESIANTNLPSISVFKKRKIDVLMQGTELNMVQKENNSSCKIRKVVAEQLIFVFNAPPEIVEIILEYNKCNVWYMYGMIQDECYKKTEWFKEIDKQIGYICYGTDSVFMQTKNGDIWCKGTNKNGELGLGHKEIVKNFILNEYFMNRKIKIKNIFTTIYSSSVTFWEDEMHKLYGCGWNADNNLGFSPMIREIMKPKLIEKIECVQQVAIGYFHSVILDQSGSVFSHKCFGQFHYFGQNGDSYNDFKNQNYDFQVIEFFRNIKIIAISVGFCHSLFVDEGGIVWSCGDNRNFELGYGHNNETNCAYPQKINYLIENKIKIEKCASRFAHNLLLDKKNNVYSFGLNEFGACGVNTKEENVAFPRMIQMTQRVENIKCGYHHSYIKTVKNFHFLFGDNDCNQCGLKTIIAEKISKPLAINEIVKKKIAAIGSFIKIEDVFLYDQRTSIKVLQLQ